MTQTRYEALKAVLDDLATFKFGLNDYYDDLEPQGVIDSVLSGKIGALRAFCQTLGWSDLVTQMQDMASLRGNAVESLEILQSFVVPEARTRLTAMLAQQGPERLDPPAKTAEFRAPASKETAIPDHIRRDILDDLLAQDVPIQGRTDLISFLRRAWNLRELPSQDHRFENAERDIWQHMVNNSDWSTESLYVERLGILDCPDAQFIKFLEAIVHPLVRNSEVEQQRYVSVINTHLEPLNRKMFPSHENSRRYVVGLTKDRDKPGVEIGEPESDSFELVLSFAGEEREYVEKVAEMLVRHGVTLFYDRYQKATLWGKDLYEHLNKVYGGDARYCVMFISKSYADKVWTTHERRSAFAAAIERREEYILPARFDDTEIGGLRKTVGYVDLRHETVDSLVELILQKLGRA